MVRGLFDLLRWYVAAGLRVEVQQQVTHKTSNDQNVMLALLFLVLIIIGLLVAIGSLARTAHARDDGRYAQSPLKPWFDSLQSSKGPCCSDADGSVLSDVDWETHDGRYRVRIEGNWYDVPDDAVLMQPNLSGKTMVWPIYYRGAGATQISIRCFIPGTMG